MTMQKRFWILAAFQRLLEKADLYEQLAQVNQQIRQERWKLKQCKEISETAVMQRDIDRA